MRTVVVTPCSPDRLDRLAGQHRAVVEHLPGAGHVVAVLAPATEMARAVREVTGTVDGMETVAVEHDRDGRVRLARARNLAADRAVELGAETVVFLDVDCLPGAGLDGVGGRLPAGSVGLGPVTYLRAEDGDPAPADLAALTAPHPARPFPADGELRHCAPEEYPRYFWSLCVVVHADTWRSIRADFGGFHEGYSGYGAEDTDMGMQLDRAGVPLVLLGGAHAYHRHHPVSDPPVEHLDDILRNGSLYAGRWGSWPMEGWLRGFLERGLIRRDGDGWQRADAVAGGIG